MPWTVPVTSYSVTKIAHLAVLCSGYGAGIDYDKPISPFGTFNVKSELAEC